MDNLTKFTRIMLPFVLGSFFCGAISCNEAQEEANQPKRIHIDSIAPNDTVFVCNGSAATRFHATDTCDGLRTCTRSVKPITKDSAEKRKRTPCLKCIREE